MLYANGTKVIPYGHQWLDEDDIAAVVDVLHSDWITQGSKVAEFEQAVADYCGAKYAVAVSSGTAALHAACFAAGIRDGDEVITSPMTFVATANAVVYCGGRPVFADIDTATLNIDPEEIRSRISPRTKAIIPVDFAGLPAALDDIRAIAEPFGLVVIEDAAHALGAAVGGRRVGSISDMTAFSFHPVKHITTGEGGMVLTDSPVFRERLVAFRQHGIVRGVEGWNPYYYEMQELGYNLRLTDFQCALGISQLRKLDEFVRRRREIAARYDSAFASLLGVILPPRFSSGDESVYHLYVIQLDSRVLGVSRRSIFDLLRGKGIGASVHYPPVHLHPYYRREFGCKAGDYPNAEAYYSRAITLPVFPKMSGDDVEYVVGVVRDAVSFGRA